MFFLQSKMETGEIKYNIFEPWKTLDPWQKKYVETEGNCFLLCGRQSGKTTAASIKFGDRAAKNKNQIILMIAYTEKQAYALFFKTLMYLRAKYPKMLITKGEKKHTKHIIHLTNGSMIMCYAAGLDGTGIRTFTVTSLVIDEAAPMAREVFTSVTPMISVTGGTIDVLSTPRGKSGYFYECSDDKSLGDKIRKNFTRFYVNAEDCPRHSIEHLEDEKRTMPSLQYAQEYLAKFLDDVKQFYSDDLIRSVMVDKPLSISREGDNFLGVDIARMGKDDSVFVSILRTGYRNEYKLSMYDMLITKKTRLTDTVNLILSKDLAEEYKKIYIDDGGLGVGVLDPLLDNDQTKRKVVGINNAKRIISYSSNKKEIGKPLMKEEMYVNLKVLMEMKEITLPKKDELFNALKSIQCEDFEGKIKLWGRDDHIVEALVRAAYCSKDTTLNPFIF